MERLGFPSIEETRDAKYQRDTYTSRTVRKKKGVHLVLLCTVQLHTTNSIASATTCRTSRVRKLDCLILIFRWGKDGAQSNTRQTLAMLDIISVVERQSQMWCRSFHWQFINTYCYALAILLYTFIQSGVFRFRWGSRKKRGARWLLELKCVHVCIHCPSHSVSCGRPWELATFSLLFLATC